MADDASEPADDRLHRATIEFGLDAEQADRFESLTQLVEPDATFDEAALRAAVDGLADHNVAEAAWTRWGDEESLGGPIDEVVEALGALDLEGVEAGGVAWLVARQHIHRGRLGDAIEALEAARPTGHRLVLCELAAFAADRSDPTTARDLLAEAGIDVDIDLDTPFDPRTADSGFGAELAEEIAPFAAVRPRPMAGRNDRCPCGSGRKYKQCHLGNELHPLEDRAGWLYVKLMRFLHTHEPNLVPTIAADLVEHVTADDMRSMVHESYLPVDLSLFEGGLAQRFGDTMGSLLPTDELVLLEAWIRSPRSVHEVERSRPGSMEVIDLADRTRRTVRDTVPDEPLEAGWKVIGRLVPVADSFRAYGGFLPVNDDMVDAMVAGFADRSLETAVLTIGQIFDTAATHDEIAGLFEDSLDTSQLRELLAELGTESADD
ncbi:MAG: YecA family protein [Ilumatobacter sp.]